MRSPSRKLDFLGIYAPISYILTGLAVLFVSLCSADEVTSDVTGPSGSNYVCAFYFIFNLLLWIPVGVIAIGIHFWKNDVERFRGSMMGRSYSRVINLIGLIIGLLLIVVSYAVTPTVKGYGVIILASLLVNLIPSYISFSLGCLITRRRREQIIKLAEQDAAPNH